MYVLVDPVFPETTATRHYPEIINFPDGHKHIKYNGPFGIVFYSIKNGDDLFLACQLADILKHKYGKTPRIICPWLFSLRCDRRFSDNEAVDAKIVVDILFGHFEQVRVHCPHVQVFGTYEEIEFDQIHELSLFSRAAQRCEADTIVIPDKGAAERFNINSLLLLCKSDSGQKPNVVICKKQRNTETGKLTGFEIESGTVGRKCLIIDDICDGGATFVGIQKLLREKGAKEVYLSVYHGIFSKGRVEGIDGVYTTNSYLTDEMAEKLGPWCRIKKVW